MEKSYNLLWLDELVMTRLNPRSNHVSQISSEELTGAVNSCLQEKQRLKNLITAEVFALRTKTEIELTIRNYHTHLVYLLDAVYESIEIPEAPALLTEALKTVSAVIEHLLSFIETRHGEFLSLDERVPQNYLKISLQEIGFRLQGLKTGVFRKLRDKQLTTMIESSLSDFVLSLRGRVTFRDILYRKDLVKALEEFSSLKGDGQIQSAVNELLIYRNFNKKAFVNHFLAGIKKRTSQVASVQDQLDQLLYAYKEFSQMHMKEGVRLNPNYTDIKRVVSNWFVHEIRYLERKMQLEIVPPPFVTGNAGAGSFKSAQRIPLNLNADQIAIILRAFAESGIIQGSSVNYVFKVLVPFLASTKRSSLSNESMRKRSYAVEDKDKKAVVAVLEKVISKVQTY